MSHAYQRTLIVLASLMLATSAWAGVDGTVVQATSIPDPSSTFSLSSLGGKNPGDQVTIDLTLDTDSQVNAFTNYIQYDAALTLDSVTLGAAIVDEAETFIEDHVGNTVRVTFDTGMGDPVTVADTDVLVSLSFTVNCADAGSNLAVEFIGGQNDNQFTDEFGSFLCPNLLDGSVNLQGHQAYIYGDTQTTLPGQTVTHTITLSNWVPGTLSNVDLIYNNTNITITSVAAGSDISSGVFPTYDDLGDDTIVSIGFVPPPALDAFEDHEVLVLTIETSTEADDYTEFINILPSTSMVTSCGEAVPANFPIPIPGRVIVPDHTATADHVDITRTSSATAYDVPFALDSTFPISEYEFRVTFDPALTYSEIVAVGSNPPPIAGVVSPGVLQINSTDGIALEDLPTAAFQIRFDAPADVEDGDTFALGFDESSPFHNQVIYYVVPGFRPEESQATVSLLGGTITIDDPPSPPTCPTLFSFSNGSFLRQNTLLAECGAGPADGHISDYLRLRDLNLEGATELHLQIREDDVAVSEFEGFELMIVDHPIEASVEITPEGDVIQLGSLYALQWAKDHQGRDITDLLVAEDGLVYQSDGEGWFDVSFGEIETFGVDQAISGSLDRKEKDRGLSGGISPKMAGTLEVLRRNADGSFDSIHNSAPRFVPDRETHTMTVPDGQELVLRYRWTGGYRSDAVEVRLAEEFDGYVDRRGQASVRHSAKGEVSLHQAPVVLHPHQTIDLTFDLTQFPALAENHRREYVFVSHGAYAKPENPGSATVPSATALVGNVPNPFNPQTTIQFSLALEGSVHLAVYDARGQLVRTLVSNSMAAGEHSVLWDGRADNGSPTASGVYFYRLTAPGFTGSGKMLMLK